MRAEGTKPNALEPEADDWICEVEPRTTVPGRQSDLSECPTMPRIAFQSHRITVPVCVSDSAHNATEFREGARCRLSVSSSGPRSRRMLVRGGGLFDPILLDDVEAP